jgi:hypothetical protein
VFAALAVLELMAATSRGAAADTIEPVRVVYSVSVAEGCPTEPEFVAAVRERLARGRLVQEDLFAREYRVGVRAVGTRFAARLDLRDQSGATRTRTLDAETCADVARAIALVTALAIDSAGFDEGPTDTEAAGPLVAGEAPAQVHSNATLPASAAPSPGESSEAPLRDVPARSSPGSSARFDLGVRATLSTPKAPGMLPGAEVFAALRDARSSWLVELGASGERGWITTHYPGEARFSFVGGRLRGCALPLRLTGRLELWPCLSLEAGAVLAEGFIDHLDTRVDAWFAAAAAGRLTYRTSAGILHLECGPVFPITRNTYVFGDVSAPEAEVHHVPPVGLQLALGGALQIF